MFLGQVRESTTATSCWGLSLYAIGGVDPETATAICGCVVVLLLDGARAFFLVCQLENKLKTTFRDFEL